MNKVWLVSVNMGYGHQRTAHPLRDLAFGGRVINANDYEGIPKRDRAIWEATRKGYEFISNFKRVPIIGEFLFFIMDQFQRILDFYPKRDLSKPNSQLKQTFSTIKKGWGRHLIEELKITPKKSLRDLTGQENEKLAPYRNGISGAGLKTNLPIISTFFTPAFMAEYFNYPGDIFCVVCDADISRAWAPFDPKESKIKYFVPTERVVERLQLYGVRPENIFLTGYPLPLENVGSEQMEVLKEDLKYRLLNLDPKRKYFDKYKILIDEKLGQLPEKSDHPLTITFCVGGAGAQKEIGIKIIKSLIEKIKTNQIKIILIAGIKEWVKNYFGRNITKMGLKNNESVEIVFAKTIEDYFQKFDQILRKTDILWTKPSELSFYSALGLPIIIAPTIGSQEEFNERWLLKSGFGILQENPRYTYQWLFDWLVRGYLAEAAMQGFIEGEKLGTLKIEKIICGL